MSWDIRAVVFDAVGTLIHPEPPSAQVYADIGRRFGSSISANEMASRFAEAFSREEARDLQAGWRTSEAREIERWRNIVARCLPEVSAQDACFREIYDHYCGAGSWRCVAEVETTLKELAQSGLSLGLASNYDSRLRQVAAGLPPLAPLTHLLISSEVGWRKPAPEFFAKVEQILNLPARHILFVGDDLKNDYQGAKAAGLHAVLFDPAGKVQGSDILRMTRLSEILAI